MDPEPPETPPTDVPAPAEPPVEPPAEPSAAAAEPEPAAESPAVKAADIAPPAPPARAARSGRRLVAIVLAVIGYAVGGYAYSQSRLSSARDSYNSVVDSENKLTDAVNALGTKLTGSNVANATSADLKSDQTLVTQLISQSQAAQTQIAADQSTLSSADSDLKQNQWLTVISKGDIDKMTTRIEHLSKALSDAKTITADYVQIGAFYQAFLDMAIDFDTLGNLSSSSDLTSVTSTIQKLKTDVAKAVSLDKAPGLPPEMDTFLIDVQAVGNDLSAVITAAASGDTAAFDAAVSAANTDTAKLDAFDFNKMGNEIDAFYKPMIDDYNSEIQKANST